MIKTLNTLKAFVFVAVLLIINSCGKKESNTPTACIQTDLPTAAVAQTINFTSCSSGATSFLWSFGDGQTAATENTTHQYAAPGTYTVTLKAGNDDGSNEKTAQITITGTTNAPFACIQLSADTINNGDTVTLTSCSNNATSYLWDFGDGTTAASATVKHAFTGAGDHLITLTAINGTGSDTATAKVVVTGPSRADYIGAYSVAETCSTSGNATYVSLISNSSSGPNSILISNFRNTASLILTATVSGSTVTIPSQTQSGYTISGTGTLNSVHGSLTITYTITDGVLTETCTCQFVYQ